MIDLSIELLPNGSRNLLVREDDKQYRVRLDTLYEDPSTEATVLSAAGDAEAVTAVNAAGRVKTLVSQALAFGDFTDNTDATGFIDFATDLPAKCIVLGWKAVVSAGFTGDTSAVLEVGESGATSRFSAVTSKACFAAGTVQSASVAATSECDAATTPRVTVTSAADFTSVAAGAMVVTIYYIDLTV